MIKHDGLIWIKVILSQCTRSFMFFRCVFPWNLLYLAASAFNSLNFHQVGQHTNIEFSRIGCAPGAVLNKK
jgi:hypothetical protein